MIIIKYNIIDPAVDKQKPYDESCKKCQTNQYGKCSVPITGEFKDYVLEECKERGNIIVEYSESEEGYDSFNVR